MYDKTWLYFTRDNRDQFEQLLRDALELHKSFTDEGVDAKTALQATGIIGTHMAKSALEINGYDTNTLSEQAVFETIVINASFVSADSGDTAPEELQQLFASHDAPQRDFETWDDETIARQEHFVDKVTTLIIGEDHNFEDVLESISKHQAMQRFSYTFDSIRADLNRPDPEQDTPGLEPDSGGAEDTPSNDGPNPNESTGGEVSDAITTEEVNPPPLYGGDPLIDASAETVVVDYLENWDTWGLGKAEITLPNGWSVADSGSNRFGTQLIAWDETVYVFEIPTAEQIQDGVLMGNGTFFRDGVVYAHEWAMETYTDDFGVSLDPPGDTLIGGTMNQQLSIDMVEILEPMGTEASA